ncbi:DUF4190 domain-containing protein [Spirillospora sp. NPDC048911]|uniref:DUF4190 domain-containing protein n=1 Tax=Spirillospora sp. NPDC048911 TaxID=3364527 RepID=UPI00371580E0
MSEQPGQGEGGVGTPGRPGLSDRDEIPGRPDLPERGDAPGDAGRPDLSKREETPGRPDLPERGGGRLPSWRTPGQGPGPRPVERLGWRALWLGAGALVITLFFFPVGLVLGAAALWVGVKARRSARRQHGVAPGAVAGVVLGSVALAFSAFSLVLTVFLWPELSGYQTCVGKANTSTDEKACRDEFYPKIEDKLNLPAGSMSKYGDLF